ncbi:MAG: hypothetical protein RL497_2136 [Pseudomonadota bacterium]
MKIPHSWITILKGKQRWLGLARLESGLVYIINYPPSNQSLAGAAERCIFELKNLS